MAEVIPSSVPGGGPAGVPLPLGKVPLIVDRFMGQGASFEQAVQQLTTLFSQGVFRLVDDPAGPAAVNPKVKRALVSPWQEPFAGREEYESMRGSVGNVPAALATAGMQGLQGLERGYRSGVGTLGALVGEQANAVDPGMGDRAARDTQGLAEAAMVVLGIPRAKVPKPAELAGRVQVPSATPRALSNDLAYNARFTQGRSSWPLEFENSIDQAAYAASNGDRKYRDFLKKYMGLTDKEIDDAGEEVLNAVRQQAGAASPGAPITVGRSSWASGVMQQLGSGQKLQAPAQGGAATSQSPFLMPKPVQEVLPLEVPLERPRRRSRAAAAGQ